MDLIQQLLLRIIRLENLVDYVNYLTSGSSVVRTVESNELRVTEADLARYTEA